MSKLALRLLLWYVCWAALCRAGYANETGFDSQAGILKMPGSGN